VSTPTLAKKRFNDVETYGARALKWISTATGRSRRRSWTHTNERHFAVDPSIAGDLSTARYYPDGITAMVQRR